MVRLQHAEFPEPARSKLKALQDEIDAIGDYSERVARAKVRFATRNVRTDSVFSVVRQTLGKMCFGAQRCCYCEDSYADEVEHMRPKDLYPQEAFSWDNYV